MPSACYRVYIYQFGVDSESGFPVRAQTNRQTDVTECPTNAGGYAGVGNYVQQHHCKNDIT